MSFPDPSRPPWPPPPDAEILAAVRAVREAEAAHATEKARVKEASRVERISAAVHPEGEVVPPEILALRSRAFKLLENAYGERIRRGYLSALVKAGAVGQDSVNEDYTTLLLRCFDSLLENKDPAGIRSLPDWISRVTWIGTQDLLRECVRQNCREVPLECDSVGNDSRRSRPTDRMPKGATEGTYRGSEFPSPEDAIAHAQLEQALGQCLETLPPELREVALDRALEVPVETLAERHGCSKGTISKWHTKAVALLRFCLKERRAL